MAMPEKAKVTRRDEINTKIKALEAMGPTNTAAVSEIMNLKNQLGYIDAESRQPQAPMGPTTEEEFRAANPYGKIGESPFFKGPARKPYGPATEEEYNAAKPYMQIGQSGFFKGPAVPKEKAVVEAPAKPVAPAIQVPLKLSQLGIRQEDFASMAESAMKVTRPLENNPVKVTKQDAIFIYTKAL